VNAIYGDCAECGFPILVKDSNPVTCPMCTAKNQPISGISALSGTSILIGIGILIAGIYFVTKSHDKTY